MKLRCGHFIPQKVWETMYRAKAVRCPKCGTTWRGYMIIENDKSQPKRELREAYQRGRMTAKEFFRGERRR